MDRVLVFILAVAIPAFASADSGVDFRSFEKPGIRESLHEAAKIDGERGLTSTELQSYFGAADTISNNSSWDKGELHIYKLAKGRTLKIDILNNNVVHGVIVTKDRGALLVWK